MENRLMSRKKRTRKAIAQLLQEREYLQAAYVHQVEEFLELADDFDAFNRLSEIGVSTTYWSGINKIIAEAPSEGGEATNSKALLFHLAEKWESEAKGKGRKLAPDQLFTILMIADWALDRKFNK
jgi:hypothetical protein